MPDKPRPESEPKKLMVPLTREAMISFLEGCDMRTFLKNASDETVVRIFQEYMED